MEMGWNRLKYILWKWSESKILETHKNGLKTELEVS